MGRSRRAELGRTPHADWLRLFRETGFEVTDYRELIAPATADEDRFAVPASWAKRWPNEQVWKLRKTR